MAEVMTDNLLGFVDKRWNGKGSDALTVGTTIFTSNGDGTTTTIVGADATLATGVNVVRVGEEFKLFTSAGVLKEEKVFKVTSVASAAGTTTVTFTPAAAANPASGDLAKKVGYENYADFTDMDTRLAAISATAYSAANLRAMNRNDKVYALRLADDPGSF